MLNVSRQLQILIAEYKKLIEGGLSHDAAIREIRRWAHSTRVSSLNKYLSEQSQTETDFKKPRQQ